MSQAVVKPPDSKPGLSSSARNWLVPVIVFLLYALAFGPLLPRLGFYLDDWPHLFFDKVGGPQAGALFHAFDGRPLSAWFYTGLSGLLGFSPLPWQVYTLAVRFLTVILMWLTFRAVWPGARWQVDAAAILFAVYPLFAQQPISVAFSVHWTAYLCFFGSLLAMTAALRRTRFSVPLVLLSAGLSLVNLILVEYFVAIELLRPVIIWLLGMGRGLPPRRQLAWVVSRWLPYLALLIGFVLWRMFWINLPVADRNETVILSQLLAAPLATGLQLVQFAIQDLVHSLAAVWYKTLTPALFDFESRSLLLSLAIGALAFGLTAGYFFVSQRRAADSQQKDWWRQGLWVGALFALVGPLPGWLVGRTVSSPSGLWNDRFGLAAMFGASLFLVAFIDLLIARPRLRWAVLAMMVGLATAWQVRNANDFRWSATYQDRFYNQLAVRIPALQPGTLLVSDSELFAKVGAYPTSFALNLFYPVSFENNRLDYYFITLGKNFGDEVERFVNGEALTENRWQSVFQGHTHASLVIDYIPENLTCLWVLGPQDALHPSISERTRQALAVSDLSRISRQPLSGYPPADVFATDLQPGWCTYYQQASLAAQFSDWPAVSAIWAQAQAYRAEMNASVELAPFIEGLIHSGDLSTAAELSRYADLTVVGMDAYLCAIWGRATAGGGLSAADLDTLDAIGADLDCTFDRPAQP